MTKPTSQLTTILYDLIRKTRGVTESDYPYHMFRGYISILRKSLTIKHIEKPFVNSFGRKGKYRVHFLTNSEKPKAIRLYKQLTSKAAQAIGEE
jgi:hypothetical protein